MLGPLEVRAGSGELLEVGGARLRTLLIMLALRPGRLVPASQLIDGLWADQAPSGPPNALQALVVLTHPLREPLAADQLRRP
jgi:DNA-binding SARP family transcriptional activator